MGSIGSLASAIGWLPHLSFAVDWRAAGGQVPPAMTTVVLDTHMLDWWSAEPQRRSTGGAAGCHDCRRALSLTSSAPEAVERQREEPGILSE